MFGLVGLADYDLRTGRFESTELSDYGSWLMRMESSTSCSIACWTYCSWMNGTIRLSSSIRL